MPAAAGRARKACDAQDSPPVARNDVEDTTQGDPAAMLFDKCQEQIRVERPWLLTPFAGDFRRTLQNRRKARLVKVLAPNPLVPRPGYCVALIGMIQEIADFLRQSRHRHDT